VDKYGMSLRTDENGNLTVLLDNIKLWPENPILTARFKGSEFYLPVTSEKGIVCEQWISLPFLAPLVAPSLVILAVVYNKRFSRKRQALQQVSCAAVTEERTTAKAKPMEPQDPQLLKIVLADIAAQFPPVWGVNEKLRMEIALDESFFEKTQDREVEVSIDAGKGVSVVLSKRGRTEYPCVFVEKGEHQIRANFSGTSEHLALNAEVRLRIVDYEEEILRLYSEFLRKLLFHGIDVRKEMTAQEIERLVMSTNNFDSNFLRKVTTCFENAEYSNHLATRRDYEILYLSLKELGIDIE